MLRTNGHVLLFWWQWYGAPKHSICGFVHCQTSSAKQLFEDTISMHACMHACMHTCMRTGTYMHKQTGKASCEKPCDNTYESLELNQGGVSQGGVSQGKDAEDKWFMCARETFGRYIPCSEQARALGCVGSTCDTPLQAGMLRLLPLAPLMASKRHCCRRGMGDELCKMRVCKLLFWRTLCEHAH